MTVTSQARASRDADQIRREELSVFRGSRRELIGPEEVGVVFTGRRRTPGHDVKRSRDSPVSASPGMPGSNRGATFGLRSRYWTP
jgi:hypothetical protein